MLLKAVRSLIFSQLSQKKSDVYDGLRLRSCMMIDLVRCLRWAAPTPERNAGLPKAASDVS
ncbi:hypothetical protein [Nostoc sp. LEGE 12450]|uniref:hypothetical protein n=1 Tax=Nostoc sp. LEGE 12450 TaxID=1828643 RepID=UPI001881946C|nr:hypothetical protein [Nostoc sp. LEGE 12450]MBE8986387.1 hypothetical protein [Nostoc sp. LEGE 12450]